MYVPEHFAMDDAAVQDLLVHHGAGDLVTSTQQGLVSTLLPFVYDAGAGPRGSLLGHFARNNEHWRLPPIGEAMVILRGPDAYITPNWYASKSEHGRVVPTWNYVTAHVHGELVIHDDVDWLDALVRRLTDKHEAGEARPWSPRRRSAEVRGRSAARDRGRGAAHQPDRGQGQAQPEPARGRHRRGDRRRPRPG